MLIESQLPRKHTTGSLFDVPFVHSNFRSLVNNAGSTACDHSPIFWVAAQKVLAMHPRADSELATTALDESKYLPPLGGRGQSKAAHHIAAQLFLNGGCRHEAQLTGNEFYIPTLRPVVLVLEANLGSIARGGNDG